MFEFSRCDVLPVDRRGGVPGGVPHLPGRVRPAHQQQRDDLLREHLRETRHLGRLPAPALSRDEVSEVFTVPSDILGESCSSKNRLGN